MVRKSLWTVCLALILASAGVVQAQPGMGMGMGGMPGMGMGGMPGMGMEMGGMGMGMGGMGMGMQAAATPKWVSPLVPLCWSVGRSPYPGIACLYATPRQRQQLEALIGQADSSINGRFWVKFVDVTLDSAPPSFISEVLDPEFRRAKGAGGAAAGGAGAMGGMEAGGMGMGMGMGMGGGMEMGGMGMGGGGQAAGSSADLDREAQKACPAIVVFGKDLFSQPKAAAGGGGQMGGGMAAGGMGAGGMGMEMGGMGMGGGMEMGGMGGMGGAAAQASMWSKMDHNYMVYWSFVGPKEMPDATVLKTVLDGIGDPDTGINRWALRLKLRKEDPGTTLELAQAYVRSLTATRPLLGRLGLDADPTRGRMVQQNQYIADYFLARAETLGADSATVRSEQKKLAPSFRYEGPTALVPLLAEHFPGAIVYYKNMSERVRVEQLLNQPSVKTPMDAAGYWCKMIDATDEDIVGPDSPIEKLQKEVGASTTESPAIVLCGQDMFVEDTITLGAAGGAGAMGAGMEMGGMGMGAGMEMGGMGMGAGGMGAPAAASDAEPTDWLMGGAAPAGAAGGAGAMGGGMEMGGMGMGGGMGMDAGMGMGMGGGMEMGGMGGGMGGGGLSMGEMAWSDYDYRMPDRLANLMVHWSFVGPNEFPTAAAMQLAVESIGDTDKGINTQVARLKADNESARLTLDAARAYVEALVKGRALLSGLGLDSNPLKARMVQQNQYMADYLLGRAETLEGGQALVRSIRAEQERLIPSFRYESANDLMPLLCEHYPGLVGFYKGMAQRRGLERLLDAQSVAGAVATNKYWVKLVEVAEEEAAKDRDLFAMLETPELKAEIKGFPALVLCGQDMFLDKKGGEDVVVLAGGAVSGAAAGGMGMGMEAGMGMGMGAGMEMGGMGGMTPGGAGAAGAAGAEGMEKPTDWMPGSALSARGVAAAGAAAPQGGMGGADTAGMPGGMGMGMGMGMEMGAGVGGATQQPSTGAIGLAGYDYRMPARTAKLMQYWVFEQSSKRSPLPTTARPDALVEKLTRAKAADDASRALKNEDKHDDVELLINTAQAYADLVRHYLADYFLARAERFIAEMGDKIEDTGKRLAASQWMTEAEKSRQQRQFDQQREKLEGFAPRVDRIRSQIIQTFADEEATTQIPVLLTAYPGLIVFYEGDEVFDPNADEEEGDKERPDVNAPSRQRRFIEQILAQPHIAQYIKDRFWVKWVRVEDGLSAMQQGLDIQPTFLTELPAMLLMGADVFAELPVTGGKGIDGRAPAAGQAGAGMGMGMGGGMEMGGMAAGPGMGGGMEMGGMPGGMGMGGMEAGGGMGAATTSGSDPTGWLPPAGTGAAAAGGAGAAGGMGMGMGAEMGMGGGMGMGMGAGMEAGGMGMGAGAAQPGADEEPIPIGVIAGMSPQGSLFSQWSDYGHINQMGNRTGNAMVHMAYVGRDGLPLRWADQPNRQGKDAADFDPFVLQLDRTFTVHRLVKSVHDDYFTYTRKESDEAYRPTARYVLDLAAAYTALPAPQMSEYMLARASKLIDDGWQPDADQIGDVVKNALDAQGADKSASAGDLLPELVNYLDEDPDRDLSLGSWMSSRSPEVWLATITAMSREATLPFSFMQQYISTNQSQPLATGATGAPATGTVFGQRLPTYFQQPPSTLTTEQLDEVRRQLVTALEGNMSTMPAEAAWSRLMMTEMELRDRRGAKGVDASWRQVMSLWYRKSARGTWTAPRRRRGEEPAATPATRPSYGDQVLAAASGAVREEIGVLRAINLIDTEIQDAIRNEDELTLPQRVDQIGALQTYLARRPTGRAAAQARYLLAILLDASMERSAAREQLQVLRSLQTPPEWWRWGLDGWERFRRYAG